MGKRQQVSKVRVAGGGRGQRREFDGAERGFSTGVFPALLIVPPFVKSSGGPALGPAMLRGAAMDAGLSVEVVDLAIEEVRARCSVPFLAQPSGVAGDHDKQSAELERAEQQFFDDLRRVAMRVGLHLTADNIRHGMLTFANATAVADALAESEWGVRTLGTLTRSTAPCLVGISVMFADQVVPALAVTRLARQCWPGVPVVWGGAHVTALAPEIACDARYGYRIDGFVSGYAEATFVALMRAVQRGEPWPSEVFSAGRGTFVAASDRMATVPKFSGLERYGLPRLTLPAQVSRGCSYGACAFCTYPSVEGAYRVPLVGTGHAEAVVDLAQRQHAVVSFKDALLTPDVFERLGQVIAGRVAWSGCTKLSSALVPLVPLLARAGCQTLEVGLESVVPATQSLIMKRQAADLFLRIADECSTHDLRLIVNYMSGFPGEDPHFAANRLAWVREQANARGARVQHQTFALERRARLAQTIRATASWPWSSVLQWREGASRRAA